MKRRPATPRGRASQSLQLAPNTPAHSGEGKGGEQETSVALSVVSANIRGGWDNKHADIISLIDAIKPTFLCIQEVQKYKEQQQYVQVDGYAPYINCISKKHAQFLARADNNMEGEETVKT